MTHKLVCMKGDKQGKRNGGITRYRTTLAEGGVRLEEGCAQSEPRQTDMIRGSVAGNSAQAKPRDARESRAHAKVDKRMGLVDVRKAGRARGSTNA